MRAIFVQDFLSAVAKPRFFVQRSLIVGVPLALMALVSSQTSIDGDGIFHWVSYSALLLLLLFVPSLVAPVLVEERFRNRLDVIRSTPISGWGLVCGRYFSRLAVGMLIIVLVVPLLAYSLLFGGVSREQLLRTLLLLPCVLTWSSSLALLISSRARNATRALRSCYGVLLAFLFLTMLLGWTISIDNPKWAPYVNPLRALGVQSSTALANTNEPFLAVATQAGLAALALLVALPLSVRGMARDLGGVVGSSRRRLKTRRPQLRDRRPLVWLELRPSRSTWIARILTLLFVGVVEWLWFAFAAWQPKGWISTIVRQQHCLIIIGWFLIGALMTVIHATSSFHNAANHRTLELLHAAPVKSRQLVLARIRGVLRSGGLWWFLSTAHLVLALVFGIIDFLGVALWGLIALTLLFALVNLMLLMGLNAKNGKKAISRGLTIFLVHLILTPMLVVCLMGGGDGAMLSLLTAHHPVFLGVGALNFSEWADDKSFLKAAVFAPIYYLVYLWLALGMRSAVIRNYEERRKEGWSFSASRGEEA